MAKRILDETGIGKGDWKVSKKSRRENSGSNGEALSKEERKEKRRLKKLRKLENLHQTLGIGVEKTEDGTKGDSDATQGPEKAVYKATRKAEKAELKTIKRAKKLAKFEQSDSSNISTPTAESTITSSAASQQTSYVTTPEPAEAGKPNSRLAVNNTAAINGGYSEDPSLTALPQTEIDRFLRNNFVTITDPQTTSNLRPITSFSYLPINDPAQRAPFKAFKAPTPIQAASWPFLLSGRDVIGIAETGSGKTMAFAVPCIRYISSVSQKKPEGVRAVIVSPTRELAVQSYEEILKLATLAGLQAVCVYGGVPKDGQRKALKTASIVVATPGRLNDLINEGFADLSRVGYAVLDEADRMLDKGFEEDIRKIISTMRPMGQRQTLMFTATWPPSVRELAVTFMTSPVKISIGDNPTGDLRANARIVQKVEVLDPRSKETRLLQLLKQYQSGNQKDDRILVFCLYKKEAIRVENFIRSKGIKVSGIHGDLAQAQRTTSLDAFKSGNVPVLVATDVAARGLDIPAVKLVINVTFPLTVEDYVHRIGRTGRAGKDGLAITMFTEHDKSQSGALINVLKGANQPVPEELLKFGTTVKKKSHDAYGSFYKDIDTSKSAKKIKFND